MNSSNSRLWFRWCGAYRKCQEIGASRWYGASRFHPLEPATVGAPQIASQPPILVQDKELDKEDTYEEWEVEEVVDSQYSYSFLKYKVKWKGHPIERRKWYRAHLFTNATEVLNDFYIKYLNKPAPRQDGLRVRQADLDSRVQERNSALEKSLTLRRSTRLALE